MEFLKYSPTYEQNRDEVEENLDKCFEYMKTVYGNNEITPREFFDIMKYSSSSNR